MPHCEQEEHGGISLHVSRLFFLSSFSDEAETATRHLTAQFSNCIVEIGTCKSQEDPHVGLDSRHLRPCFTFQSFANNK